MYVCLCKGITDHQIRDAVYEGATSLGKVRKALGVASQCGKCAETTREILTETLSPGSEALQASYYAVV